MSNQILNLDMLLFGTTLPETAQPNQVFWAIASSTGNEGVLDVDGITAYPNIEQDDLLKHINGQWIKQRIGLNDLFVLKAQLATRVAALFTNDVSLDDAQYILSQNSTGFIRSPAAEFAQKRDLDKEVQALKDTTSAIHGVTDVNALSVNTVVFADENTNGAPNTTDPFIVFTEDLFQTAIDLKSGEKYYRGQVNTWTDWSAFAADTTIPTTSDPSSVTANTVYKMVATATGGVNYTSLLIKVTYNSATWLLAVHGDRHWVKKGSDAWTQGVVGGEPVWGDPQVVPNPGYGIVDNRGAYLDELVVNTSTIDTRYNIDSAGNIKKSTRDTTNRYGAWTEYNITPDRLHSVSTGGIAAADEFLMIKNNGFVERTMATMETVIEPVRIKQLSLSGYSITTTLGNGQIAEGDVYIGTNYLVYINPLSAHSQDIRAILDKSFYIEVTRSNDSNTYVRGIIAEKFTVFADSLFITLTTESYETKGTFANDDSVIFKSFSRHPSWGDVEHTLPLSGSRNVLPSSKAVKDAVAVAENVHVLTAQTTAAADDVFEVIDTDDSNTRKKITSTNLKNSIISLINGTPSNTKVIGWDEANTRASWVDNASGSGSGNISATGAAYYISGADYDTAGEISLRSSINHRIQTAGSHNRIATIRLHSQGGSGYLSDSNNSTDDRNIINVLNLIANTCSTGGTAVLKLERLSSSGVSQAFAWFDITAVNSDKDVLTVTFKEQSGDMIVDPNTGTDYLVTLGAHVSGDVILEASDATLAGTDEVLAIKDNALTRESLSDLGLPLNVATEHQLLLGQNNSTYVSPLGLGEMLSPYEEIATHLYTDFVTYDSILFWGPDFPQLSSTQSDRASDSLAIVRPNNWADRPSLTEMGGSNNYLAGLEFLYNSDTYLLAIDTSNVQKLLKRNSADTGWDNISFDPLEPSTNPIFIDDVVAATIRWRVTEAYQISAGDYPATMNGRIALIIKEGRDINMYQIYKPSGSNNYSYYRYTVSLLQNFESIKVDLAYNSTPAFRTSNPSMITLNTNKVFTDYEKVMFIARVSAFAGTDERMDSIAIWDRTRAYNPNLTGVDADTFETVVGKASHITYHDTIGIGGGMASWKSYRFSDLRTVRCVVYKPRHRAFRR